MQSFYKKFDKINIHLLLWTIILVNFQYFLCPYAGQTPKRVSCQTPLESQTPRLHLGAPFARKLKSLLGFVLTSLRYVANSRRALMFHSINLIKLTANIHVCSATCSRFAVGYEGEAKVTRNCESNGGREAVQTLKGFLREPLKCL